MTIVDILRVKFNFLAKRLPKLFIKQTRRKESEEEKSKYNDLHRITGKIPLTEAEPVKGLDLNFYTEYSKKYASRDIDDILQETKHIIQKMLALMQSVINTLCGCPGARTKTNLSQLSKFFRSAINYFVIKTAIHKIYGKNLKDEMEEMCKNVRLFLETFMRMDLASFAQIAENEMGFFCDCIVKPVAADALKELKNTKPSDFNNDFLMIIPRYIRDEAMKQQGNEKNESIKGHICVFAYLLLKHLLQQFDKIGGYKITEQTESNITMYNHYLELFKCGMETFCCVENNEQINSLYFHFIVLCIKYSRKSIFYNNYFEAFRSICQAIKKRSLAMTKEILVRDYPFRELVTLLPGILPIFLSARKECTMLNKPILDIIQNLLISYNSLIEYMPILIHPLTACISNLRPADIVGTTSLKSLDSWFSHALDASEFADMLQGMAPELIPYLHKLFNTQSIMHLPNRMLGYFGGKSRPYVTEKEASTKF